MADFICLSMASQYSTDQNDTSVAVSASSSFRRSLNLSTGLLGRQFSRSISSAGGGGSVDNNSNNNNDNSDNSKKTMQVRIVPNIENPSRSLIFDVINRELQTGKVIKIGRFTDRVQASDHISFKSKVVSRSHCEIWLETDGKLYLRDTKSSSGTFLNHVRLSSANMESRPVEIRDGDIVQLGVDYQGGLNEIYRAVKMRFEINQTPQSNSFNVSAFNNLRQFTASSLVDPQTATCSDAHMTDKSCISNSDNSAAGGGEFQVDECCICLYALAPLQALFVAPCSHSYHFKCIRPLLQSYPGFQCPICRTYSDLEASVAIEPEEVAEKFGLQMGKQADRILDETNNETHQEQRHPLQQAQTTTTTPSPSAAAAETASSPPPPPPLVDTTAGVASNLLDDTLVLSPTNLSTGSEELHTDQRRATIMLDEPFAQPQQQDQQRQQQQQQQQTTRSRGTLIAERRLSPANLVDKLKMAFSDKRKQPILVTKPNSRHNRPLSHPGRWRRDEDMDVDEDDEDGFNSDDQIAGSSSSSYASPSSSPPQRSPMHLARTLSRQSTNPLGNILEESIHT